LTVADVALVAVTLLALGYVCVLALTLLPATAATGRQVLPVLNTEAIIVVVGLCVFLAPPSLRIVLLAAMAARIIWEAASVAALRVPGERSALWQIAAVAAVSSATAFGIVSQLPPHLSLPVVLLLGGLLLAATRLPGRPLVRLAGEVGLFPGLPIGLFIAAAMTEHKLVATLVVLVLVETFDSYALLGGKLFGRHPAFPRLSPRKTVEGLLAGAAMLLVTAVALAWATGFVTTGVAAGVALAVGLASVVGDLAASRIKRASGVKDFPAIMRHQGGLLDITDAGIVAGAVLALVPI
jgi:CDP-diglyceride synthetase